MEKSPQPSPRRKIYSPCQSNQDLEDPDLNLNCSNSCSVVGITKETEVKPTRNNVCITEANQTPLALAIINKLQKIILSKTKGKFYLPKEIRTSAKELIKEFTALQAAKDYKETSVTNNNLHDTLQELTHLTTITIPNLTSEIQQLNNTMKITQSSRQTSTPVNNSTKTYSEALKTKPTIVIEKTNKEVSRKLSNIKTSIRPKGVYNRQNYIEIKCRSHEDSTKLKETLTKENLRVNDKPLPTMKIIILSLPEDTPEKYLLEAIKEDLQLDHRNPEIQITQIRKTLSIYNLWNYVIEMPRFLAIRLLKNRRIFIGIRSYRLEKFLAYRRCQKCQDFSHPTNNCPHTNLYCGRCGENHNTPDCQAKKAFCINCHAENKKGENLNVNHPAYDRRCPTLLKYSATIKPNSTPDTPKHSKVTSQLPSDFIP